MTARDERDKLIVVGKRIYAVCPDCGGLVKVNKRILGSLHLCVGIN